MLRKRIVLLALAIGLIALASALWLADRPQRKIDRLDERWRQALQAGGERAPGAATLLDQAAALREELFANEPLTLAASLNDLAADVLNGCLVPADVQERAGQLLRRALALRAGSRPEVVLARAETLESLSVLAQMQGDWQGAEQNARQALALYEQVHGKEAPGIVDGLVSLAGALIDLGRYSDAARQYDRALRILGRPGPGSYRLHAEIQNELGELHRLRNDYGHAEEAYGKAREHALKVLPEEDLFLLRVSNNLAGLYLDRGEYSLAEPRYRRSLALRKDACREDLATAELNLAEIYRLQGDFKRAEPLYDSALKHAAEGLGEDHPEMVYFYNREAVLYADQERYGDAAEYHDVALQLTRAALGDRHPLVAQSLHDLAKLHDANGRHLEAQRLYREALGIREQFLGPEHPEAGVTLTWLAASLARGGRQQQKTAFETVERALRIFLRTEAYPEDEAKAFEIRAMLQRNDGKRQAALADLGRSLEIVEDLRPRSGGGEQARAGFLARHADTFHRMVEWEVEEKRLDRAFEYAERRRARVLVDQLLAARLDLLDSIPDPARRKDLSARQAAAQARLAEVQKQISVLQAAGASRRSALPGLSSLLAGRDEAEREVREVEDEIRSESLLWKRSGRAEPVSLSSAQSRLVPRDGLILLYEIGPERSFVLVIPEWGEEATVHPLAVAAGAAAELGVPAGPLTREKLDRVLLGTGDRAGLLRRLGEHPARRPGGPEAGGKALAQGLHGLWEVLVPAPVWQQVKPRSQVLVVPDGLLHRLPLEALVTRRGAKGIEDSSFWLDEGPPLRYSASATALAALLDRSRSDSRDRPGGPSILSVSDPIYAGMEGREPSPLRGQYERLGGSLTRLPATAAETGALLELFGDSVQALQRGAADERRVRSGMPGKRYLHLATHGVVAEGRELFAALVLTSPAAGPVTASDDGFLQLFEIYPLELGCELAVLSACRTAFGAPREGEGVFTLSRGFLVAGAKRVVASLWLVSDPASAALFKQFFHEVARSDRRGLRPDYTKGLRDAKAQLVKTGTWKDPYFWAPFILTGEE